MKTISPDGRELPRVAVVGCGYWGKNLVRNFHQLGTLTVLCDADHGVASRLAEQFGVGWSTYDDILRDSTVDAVAIATPAAQHADLAKQALKSGKHVFVEKPIALDVGEAEALCDVAEARQLVLMVGHLLQYHPAYLRLRQFVDSGDLGRVQYIYSNRLNLGRIRREEDILWSFAPHDISMILGIVRTEPEGVSAVGGTYLHDRIADVTTTHLSFPAGERAHVFVSWLHPVKEQRLVVVGDRGMAVFDDGLGWDEKLRIYRHRIDWHEGLPTAIRAMPEAIPLEEEEPLRAECQHFLECVVHLGTPRTDGREGVRVLRVLQAASEAMHQRSSPSSLQRRAGVSIHPSAVVDQGCKIGSGTKIWHFSHILPGSRIGTDCNIGQNVMIGPDVIVGNRCKIQNNVSVYKGVTLGDDVFCGPSCVFTNVRNPRAAVDRGREFEPTVVGSGATIGANATIVCGTAIGSHAFIGAGAVVTVDVAPHALVVGVPARQIGWVSHEGERLDEDLRCPRSGRQYGLATGGGLYAVS